VIYKRILIPGVRFRRGSDTFLILFASSSA
jgi:hypothetical protein